MAPPTAGSFGRSTRTVSVETGSGEEGTWARVWIRDKYLKRVDISDHI